MNGDILEVVRMIMAVNVAAVLLLVVMSFVGSALALEGLEKLDTWMRRKDEKRLFRLKEEPELRVGDQVEVGCLNSQQPS